jgi:uncharacterized protein YbjT (DUF2867 family)
MSGILVFGASGFAGKRLARALLEGGHTVRCLARTPAKIADLAAAGCEVVQGDMSDAASVMRAAQSMDAVYVAVRFRRNPPVRRIRGSWISRRRVCATSSRPVSPKARSG